ncbi:hypothetical protein Q4543_24340, partial [Salipiger sp. 1_MG-2023]|uniref:hypothetical protein n=1 Tax=Salipiger sp. 1_MG-2023 TaxID=3062665 RepID=UPI0026E36C92
RHQAINTRSGRRLMTAQTPDLTIAPVEVRVFSTAPNLLVFFGRDPAQGFCSHVFSHSYAVSI